MRARNFIGVVVALLSSIAHAEEIPPSPIVKTQLLVDAPAVKKDVPVWAGVKFTIPKNWHIYWQNPGDSGIPTTYQWTLPVGLAAGEISWPTPERLEMSGLVNYGYSDEVILPVPLTPARDGIAGNVVVKANWLVCHETCIPESATLSAPLAAGAVNLADYARDHGPVPLSTGPAHYYIATDGVTLTIPWEGEAVTTAEFFPLEDGVISNSGAQTVQQRDGQLMLTMARGSSDAVDPWHGVLTIHTAQGARSYSIAATAVAPVHATTLAKPRSMMLILLLAFAGGLILNIMPCVLPILALKALAIARKAQASRRAAAQQGIAYTAGVVVSFLVIAAGMLVLKASGAAIGWGFQLQNTGFVAALAMVMLLVAANLLGLFSLPVLFGTHAHEVNENSKCGSFLTGALAVLVATPCTAPFMATAIGATLTLPIFSALLVFATLGLGMASPFLLISLWPAALRLIPKPGAWMHRFKQLLAIPMLATAAWLFWVLAQMLQPAIMPQQHAFSMVRLEQLRASKTPVLVDVTAAWCLSCKVNERVALKPESMQQFFRAKNVTVLVADWTTNDPAITDYLASFGRNGVPLYVYYAPDAAPVVLPQILTPSIVRNIIDSQHD